MQLTGRAPVRIPATPPTRGLTNIGVVFLLSFLLLTYSRIPDIFLSSLHLPLIASLLALSVAVVTGGVQRALLSNVGFCLTALTVWLIVAVPFSFWPGGSVQALTRTWLKSFLVFIIVAGLLRSTKDCRAAMYSIGLAALAVVVMSITVGGTSEQGRLMLPSGVLANSNYLAHYLLMGLPFLGLLVISKGRVFIRALVGVGIVGVLLALGRTGSRSALVAMACLALVMIFTLSWAHMFRLVAALLLSAALVVPFISDEQKSRYLTLFQEESTAEMETGELSAVGSTQQRMGLLWDSLGATMTHPVFGVGPGVFQAAAARQAELENVPATWRETHNMYTQVSSEAGIPALIFFLGALVGSTSMAYKVWLLSRTTPELTNVGKMGYCLFLSLISLAVTGFFSSVAYETYLPTLAGLSLALSRSAAFESSMVRKPDPSIRRDTPLIPSAARSRYTPSSGRTF